MVGGGGEGGGCAREESIEREDRSGLRVGRKGQMGMLGFHRISFLREKSRTVKWSEPMSMLMTHTQSGPLVIDPTRTHECTPELTKINGPNPPWGATVHSKRIERCGR